MIGPQLNKIRVALPIPILGLVLQAQRPLPSLVGVFPLVSAMTVQAEIFRVPNVSRESPVLEAPSFLTVQHSAISNRTTDHGGVMVVATITAPGGADLEALLEAQGIDGTTLTLNRWPVVAGTQQYSKRFPLASCGDASTIVMRVQNVGVSSHAKPLLPSDQALFLQRDHLGELRVCTSRPAVVELRLVDIHGRDLRYLGTVATMPGRLQACTASLTHLDSPARVLASCGSLAIALEVLP